MPKNDIDKLGADYRHAKKAVADHLRRQAALELEQAALLKRLRGVPADELYDRATGAPLDPQLAELEERIAQAEVDVRWCQSLVIACGEAYKGVKFDEVPDGPNARRAMSRMVV